MEERTARWLLMTHDRVGADTFPLTQEFLSSMLAVRRATVNVATGVFKKAGLIRYVRGRVTVIDRHVLECASCDRHAAIERAYNCSENRPLAAVCNRIDSDGPVQLRCRRAECADSYVGGSVPHTSLFLSGSLDSHGRKGENQTLTSGTPAPTG